MNNTMIRANNIVGEIAYVTVPTCNTSMLVELFSESGCANIVTFESGTMKLEDLPESIQMEVMRILKAFHRVTVTYEYGKFNVSTGCCIKAEYGIDHFVCGRYTDEEVYTEEEREQNYKELCGY